MTASCACGAVSVTIKAPPPFIFDCNCSLCRKTGAAWGYFAPDAVQAEGETVSFSRNDKPLAAVEIHSCARCSATTHWVRTEGFKTAHGQNDMAGVNMRLFDPDTLNGVDVQFPDGKTWSGEGEFGFRRDAIHIGKDARW